MALGRFSRDGEEGAGEQAVVGPEEVDLCMVEEVSLEEPFAVAGVDTHHITKDGKQFGLAKR